jgi:chemotaxis signal transduction protein
VPIDAVERTERPTAVTPVPRAPDWVRGVTSLRGDVITVVELNQLLAREGVQRLEDVRSMLVLSHDGRRLAIQSTSLPDFVRVTAAQMMSLPPAEIDVYAGGIERDGSLIGLLELPKLFEFIERRLADA